MHKAENEVEVGFRAYSSPISRSKEQLFVNLFGRLLESGTAVFTGGSCRCHVTNVLLE